MSDSINRFTIFNTKIIGKVLCLFLVVLILYNSFGFVAMHFIRLARIKADVSESIRNNSFTSDLVLLAFNKDELEGNDPVIDRIDRKEFRYKGKYYDIVKEKIEADSVYYYCIYDEDESFLDLLFVNHFEKQKDEKSSQRLFNGSFLKILTDYYLNSQIIPPENYQVENFVQCSDNIFTCYFPDIPTPPPNTLI